MMSGSSNGQRPHAAVSRGADHAAANPATVTTGPSTSAMEAATASVAADPASSAAAAGSLPVLPGGSLLGNSALLTMTTAESGSLATTGSTTAATASASSPAPAAAATTTGGQILAAATTAEATSPSYFQSAADYVADMYESVVSTAASSTSVFGGSSAADGNKTGSSATGTTTSGGFLIGGILQGMADAAAYTGDRITQATFSLPMLVMAATFTVSALAHIALLYQSRKGNRIWSNFAHALLVSDSNLIQGNSGPEVDFERRSAGLLGVVRGIVADVVRQRKTTTFGEGGGGREKGTVVPAMTPASSPRDPGGATGRSSPEAPQLQKQTSARVYVFDAQSSFVRYLSGYLAGRNSGAPDGDVIGGAGSDMDIFARDEVDFREVLDEVREWRRQTSSSGGAAAETRVVSPSPAPALALPHPNARPTGAIKSHQTSPENHDFSRSSDNQVGEQEEEIPVIFYFATARSTVISGNDVGFDEGLGFFHFEGNNCNHHNLVTVASEVSFGENSEGTLRNITFRHPPNVPPPVFQSAREELQVFAGGAGSSPSATSTEVVKQPVSLAVADGTSLGAGAGGARDEQEQTGKTKSIPVPKPSSGTARSDEDARASPSPARAGQHSNRTGEGLSTSEGALRERSNRFAQETQQIVHRGGGRSSRPHPARSSQSTASPSQTTVEDQITFLEKHGVLRYETTSPSTSSSRPRIIEFSRSCQVLPTPSYFRPRRDHLHAGAMRHGHELFSVSGTTPADRAEHFLRVSQRVEVLASSGEKAAKVHHSTNGTSGAVPSGIEGGLESVLGFIETRAERLVSGLFRRAGEELPELEEIERTMSMNGGGTASESKIFNSMKLQTPSSSGPQLYQQRPESPSSESDAG